MENIAPMKKRIPTIARFGGGNDMISQTSVRNYLKA